jgi:hypothetical protein
MPLRPSKQSVTIRHTQPHLLLLKHDYIFRAVQISSGHYYKTFKIRYNTVLNRVAASIRNNLNFGIQIRFHSSIQSTVTLKCPWFPGQFKYYLAL